MQMRSDQKKKREKVSPAPALHCISNNGLFLFANQAHESKSGKPGEQQEQ
jgi:hypothetical protein